MTSNSKQPINEANSPLPNTMAGLLETAIRDARRLNKAVYYPHFEQWHKSLSHGLMHLCEVCLAGSIISGTLRASSKESKSPYCFGPRTHKLLLAIDDMRNGNWWCAFVNTYSVHPSESLYHQLRRIPKPDCIEFTGWKQFEQHLDSLETLLPHLRQIDEIWKESATA